MKIISWNVSGLGCRVKRAVIKDILHSYISNIGLIQKTKLNSVFENVVKEIRGDSSVDNWVCCKAIGASRGIMVLWNGSAFCKKRSMGGRILCVCSVGGG